MDLMTVAQVADELGKPRSTVLSWITRGALRATKIGAGRTSAYLVDRDDLAGFLDTRRVS